MNKCTQRTTLRVLSGKEKLKDIFTKQFSCGQAKFWDMNNLIFIQLVCPNIIKWTPYKNKKEIYVSFIEDGKNKDMMISYESFSKDIVCGRKIKCNYDFSKIFIDLLPGEIEYLDVIPFLNKIGVKFEIVKDYKKVIEEIRAEYKEDKELDKILNDLIKGIRKND